MVFGWIKRSVRGVVLSGFKALRFEPMPHAWTALGGAYVTQPAVFFTFVLFYSCLILPLGVCLCIGLCVLPGLAVGFGPPQRMPALLCWQLDVLEASVDGIQMAGCAPPASAVPAAWALLTGAPFCQALVCDLPRRSVLTAGEQQHRSN